MNDALIALLAAACGVLALFLLTTLPAAWREQKKINKLLRNMKDESDD